MSTGQKYVEFVKEQDDRTGSGEDVGIACWARGCRYTHITTGHMFSGETCWEEITKLGTKLFSGLQEQRDITFRVSFSVR